jgi:hypothetical protein
MKNGINVVGDVGVGDYQVTWDQRFTECELFGSYSHPLPIIGSFILFNLSLILFKTFNIPVAGMNQTRNMNYYFFKNVTIPSVISTSFTNDLDEIVFNLTSLYPVPSLVSLIRSNLYIRTIGIESVVIQDLVIFNSPTNYEFGIGSRNGYWRESSVSSNVITGTYTVDSTSINLKVQSLNPLKYEAVTKTVNLVTYTRLKIFMSNPITSDIIIVTYN